MSLILALDTATDRATLALGTPQSPGDDLALTGRRDLSRDIDRAAARLLTDRGVTPRDLTGVVVADGPGGFTGLRIGVAFAKGVCRALGVPLFTAPSLLGAAWAVARAVGPPGGGPLTVVAVYDALRGDVYRAAWRLSASGGVVVVVTAPHLAHAGAPVAGPEAALRAGAAHASAAALLTLVGVTGGAVSVEDPGAWTPTYGRLAEAEARRLARDGSR